MQEIDYIRLAFKLQFLHDMMEPDKQYFWAKGPHSYLDSKILQIRIYRANERNEKPYGASPTTTWKEIMRRCNIVYRDIVREKRMFELEQAAKFWDGL